MKKSEVKPLCEVLTAWSEGKVIQAKGKRDWTVNTWHDITQKDNFTLNAEDFDYRVKPEPEIKPYSSAEEFLEAKKKHGPMLTAKTDGIYEFFSIVSINWNDVCIGNRDELVTCTSHELSKYYMWEDKTPCGVEETV